MDWWRQQWNDIKGNVKYGLLVALWWAIIEIGKRLLRYIPNIPTWAVWAILLGISLLVFAWVVRSMKHIAVQQPITPNQNDTGALALGIPALSALLGQNPPISFDVKAFFAQAYYSPVTAEFEKNIKTIAQQNFPNDKERFYARFIGVGAIAYQHDVTWFTIYRSQVSALAELNARGIIPLADVKKHFDKAVIEYPRTYAHYSFDQWINYMQARLLVATYPTGMVEIAHGGKDFLKYVAHRGWDFSAKAN